MSVSTLKAAVIGIASLLSVGCASTGALQTEGPFLTEGDVVSQHANIVVPIDSYRAKAASSGLTKPYCFYEVDQIRRTGEAPLVIESGQFTVKKIHKTASPLGGAKLLSMPSWMRPQHVDLIVQIDLESESQPHVKSLNCARRFYSAAGARYPDLMEMRLALRGMASIQRQIDLAFYQQ